MQRNQKTQRNTEKRRVVGGVAKKKKKDALQRGKKIINHCVGDAKGKKYLIMVEGRGGESLAEDGGGGRFGEGGRER